MARETIMRHQIADYLGIPGEGDAVTYSLMGTGFNTLDEKPISATVRRPLWSRAISRFSRLTPTSSSRKKR